MGKLTKKKIDKYLKYYHLEDYLFDEVGASFRKKHYLTAEEFFAIVIWKSNRSRTTVEVTRERIKDITSEIYNADDQKSKDSVLKSLVSIKGIGISIASAILTVCRPNDFTIVDYRTIASLKKLKITFTTIPSSSCGAYFEYFEVCKVQAKKYNLSLRKFDKILWGMDFYEGERGLKDIASSAD